MIEKIKKQEKKTLFKSVNASLPPQFNTILQESKQLLNYLRNFYTE